jgi:16S rRNA (guanine966-N2)-methyltransferase
MAGKLRITGGMLSRRLFKVPDAADKGLVRPTGDLVRGAIFSSLFTQIVDAKVLDLFAGSGSHGFEAISRGAKKVVFIEKDPQTAYCIKTNIADLNVADFCELIIHEAVSYIMRAANIQKYDLVFVDPPYKLQLESSFWNVLLEFMHKETIVIFRCDKKANFIIPKCYESVKQKNYGGMQVYFLKKVYSS